MGAGALEILLLQCMCCWPHQGLMVQDQELVQRLYKQLCQGVNDLSLRSDSQIASAHFQHSAQCLG